MDTQTFQTGKNKIKYGYTNAADRDKYKDMPTTDTSRPKKLETAGDCWKVLEHRWLFNGDLIEDREWGNVPAVTGL